MNLFDLCVIIAHGIQRACRACFALLANMLRLTYRGRWIISIIVVLALALAIFQARPTARWYKVDGIVALNGTRLETAKQSVAVLANCHPLFETQNLATLLELDSEVAAGLRKFRTFDVIDCLDDGNPDYVDYAGSTSFTDTLKIHMENRMAIQFEIRGTEHLAQVEEAIMHYLNTRPYAVAQYEAYYQGIKQASEVFNAQLAKMDSLSSIYYQQPVQAPQTQMARDPKDGSFVISGKREVVMLDKDFERQMTRIRQTDQQLAITTAPMVLDNHFYAHAKAENGYLYCIIRNVLIAWILGLLIVALIEYRKQIIAWLKR